VGGERRKGPKPGGEDRKLELSVERMSRTAHITFSFYIANYLRVGVNCSHCFFDYFYVAIYAGLIFSRAFFACVYFCLYFAFRLHIVPPSFVVLFLALYLYLLAFSAAKAWVLWPSGLCRR
jgi:hypothetical protein